ncbi:MAG: hypothetical protein NC093_00035 [Alistipes sp.]|nr:hypothetical protein [Alistipes sp.]
MKNANVQKINTVGKVCRIILTVFRVFVIIGIVGCLIGAVLGGIAAGTMPDDAVKADISVNGTVSIDGASIPSFVSDEINDLEELEGTNLKVGFGNFKVKLLVDKLTEGSVNNYTIDGNAYITNGSAMVIGVVGVCVVAAIACGIMLAVVIFGGKLAKALETCDSPFEEKVIKAMKSFAFSLIPVGVVTLAVDGALGLTMIFIVAAIILFAFIFKYGAELQQQADDTV